MNSLVVWFEELTIDDVPSVGGKNASLGEMVRELTAAGVQVPGGFATTADAYRTFLAHEELDQRIYAALRELDIEDVQALSRTGGQIRQWIMDTPFPAELETAIRDAYAEMERRHTEGVSVAVRSSATAEDLPNASFAGQQETFLNIAGIDAVLHAVKGVFASLFNDRAITYREHHGFEHDQVALSAGVQRMVRSDIGASGVMFTLDTESGFRDAVFITAAWGLGETVVQGAVNPDEFYLHKPLLREGRPAIIRRIRGEKAVKMVYREAAPGEPPVETVEVPEAERLRFALDDDDLIELGRQAIAIEDHYGRPMDIEWAKDGGDGGIFIVQARPETVKSRSDALQLEEYRLHERGEILAEGRAIGGRIGDGPARIVDRIEDMHRVEAGDVLITDMTDPDWEPVMKRAAAIVTNRGGRTCHAAIIARELGIPAVVGCGDATEQVPDGAAVTVSCAEGDTGNVYRGKLDYERSTHDLDRLPELPVKIMMNVANPDQAFNFQALPNHGVGLARLEFIINKSIAVHPRAVLEYAGQSDEIKQQIDRLSAGYTDPVSFYVDKLAEGISTIAAAFWPKKVIVRMSDFKSNEYAHLLGGTQYEPEEENPMLGFRGAARYISEAFRPCFELECRALNKVRKEIGLINVDVMIPFVRTLQEAEQVVSLLADNGLKRGEDGLRLIMMCELPSNPLLADEFLEHFDGFSIGSNDLTQLTLGLDRDSGLVSASFDERNPAVKALIAMAIEKCRAKGKYIGICGQGPSDHPDLAAWLIEQGIETVSLNPDSVLKTWLHLAKRHPQ
ncbi:phosphoenolpyruvate synthase [Thiohalobacter sp. COW1]|uniref:phosphoenolpyruvate synthase n=1 Tax=Thiohalobacter sp. COW1 TaxID=2795687 RepID=UPI0019167B02|nr:phosphoenolpyruvate synthase [Thiohalobacter sp. COW1]BCO30176.1 phosphoenolpyruvate synthase [Thiohalobacter sp. COW1]